MRTGSREIKRIIIHHSASPRDTTTKDMIDGWHRARGFKGIGYHYVIEKAGQVVRGRPLTASGAHCLADGANRDSIGICLVGNNLVKAHRWNQPQLDSLMKLLNDLTTQFGDLPVFGHREVEGANTLCPGVKIYGVLTRGGLIDER